MSPKQKQSLYEGAAVGVVVFTVLVALWNMLLMSGCTALMDPNSTASRAVADANTALETVGPALVAATAPFPWGWIVGLGVLVASGTVNALYSVRHKNLKKTTTAIVDAVEKTTSAEETKKLVGENLDKMEMYKKGTAIIDGIKAGLLK